MNRLQRALHRHRYTRWAGDMLDFYPEYRHNVLWACRCGAVRTEDRSGSVDPLMRQVVDEANRVNGTNL